MRYYLFSILLFLAIGLNAQRPRYDKMSPFVREAMASSLTAKQLTRSYSEDRILTAFVRIDGMLPNYYINMEVKNLHG